MFRLFKLRNFSEIFNDTFGFIRATGKNYFRNYIIVNSPFLVLLLILTFFISKIFLDAVLGSVGVANSNRVIEEMFNNNVPFFVITTIVIVVLFVIITMLNYAYPVIYMKLYEDNAEPTTKQIVSELKKSISKIILYVLLWFISFLPIGILVGFFSALLFITIIGIPFVFLLWAYMLCWMIQTFYDYLNGNSGYFESFGNGFSVARSKFWTHSGATLIIVIIVYIVQLVVSLLPAIFGVASLFSPVQEQVTQEEALTFAGIVAIVFYIISTITGYILGNIISISQGMIYYSYREENESHSTFSEIDQIGLDSE